MRVPAHVAWAAAAAPDAIAERPPTRKRQPPLPKGRRRREEAVHRKRLSAEDRRARELSLIRLYVDERKSLSECSAAVHLSKGGVGVILRKAGVQLRPRGNAVTRSRGRTSP